MLKTGRDHADDEKKRERKTETIAVSARADLFDPVTVLNMPQLPLTRVKLFCSVV